MDKKKFLRVILIPPLFVFLAAGVFYVARVFSLYSTVSSSGLSRMFRTEGDGIRLPVFVTVFGRGTDTISARLSFSTPNGKSVGALERSWNGWQLTLDCLVLTLPDAPLSFAGFLKWLWGASLPVGARDSAPTLVFPVLLYADDERARSAFNLPPYYDDDGFPLLYQMPGLSEQEREALSGIFAMVKAERVFPGFFKTFSRRKLRVRVFEPGVEYTLFLGGDGELSLVR